MRKVVLLAMIFGFSLPACSPDGEEPITASSSSAKSSSFKEVTLTEADVERQVNLAQNAMVVVKLPANPSTGYTWTVKDMKRSVVRRVQGTANGPEFIFSEKRPIPGAPAMQVLRFVGVSAGKSTIQLSHERPWEQKPTAHYSFKVQSMGKFMGVFEAPQAKPYTPPPKSEIAAAALPSHFDWREQNAVTAVRDQGQCGSCWAFGTVAAFEAKIKRKDGIERDLSEQYVVSCNPWGMGCGGGWWGHPLHHMYVPNGESGAGAVHEGSFPYTATQEPCNPPHPHEEQIEGWGYVDGVPDEPWPTKRHTSTTAELKQAIYTHGPIATALCSSNWGSYTGGVLTSSCSPTTHIVLITGWDDADGAFYIKNSWGTGWGENGYIRLAYGISEVGDGATYVEYDKTNPRIVYQGARFYEAPENNGTIPNSLTLKFLDPGSGRFAVSSGNMSRGTHFTVSSLPSGLTMNVRATSRTTATVSLSGTASSHLDANDATMTLTFLDAAFSGISASGVENSSFQLTIDFYDPYKIIYEDINPDLTCTWADPWKFFWVVSSDYTNSFGLWYNEGVHEPDPCNKTTYKLETYSRPALSTGTTMPGDLIPLSYGEYIDASSRYWCEGGTYGDQHTVAGPCYSAWNGREAYAGVTLNINGWDVFGWIRLRVNSYGTSVTVLDLGYNQDPLAGISAGQQGEQPGPPDPEFTADKTTVGVGEAVHFTDLSTGNPDSWYWMFTGGTPATSTLQNPTATWSTPGSYTVGLAAYNAFGSNTLYKNGYITVTDAPQPLPPVAEFTASATNIAPGDSVTFTDQSTNNPTSWSWSFPGGNPSSSSAQNPRVTYNSAGNFDVTLTVSNADGTDTITKYGLITVSDTPQPLPPEADFRASATTIAVGGSVTFTDLSTNNPTEWMWEFPGGTPMESTSQNPTVVYEAAGVYEVILEVSNAYGTGVMEKADYITVTDSPQPQPPVAEFTASSTSVTLGGNVTFTDQSTNSPTSWSWSFPGGNPSSSSAQNPRVTYNSVGSFDVSLTVSNGYGSDTMRKASYITVSDGSPIVYCSASHLYDHNFISLVELENISNASSWGSSGYSDFTAQSTPLARGQSFTILVETENDHWSDNAVAVWIDWDQNGVFDTAERVYATNYSGPYEGSFSVPSGARVGSTRMRVRLAYYDIPGPCGAINYLGEAEDYTIMVE